MKASILIKLVLFVWYHKIKSSQLNQNCSFCSLRRLKENYSSQKALNERGVFFPVGAYTANLGHNSLPNCHYKSINPSSIIIEEKPILAFQTPRTDLCFFSRIIGFEKYLKSPANFVISERSILLLNRLGDLARYKQTVASIELLDVVFHKKGCEPL